MKIAVIGYSGAGKSTLARALAKGLGLPLLHLDQVHFLPGWAERDPEEARALTAAFLERESWVIDGNYAGLLQERRMEEADRIVFLDVCRGRCLLQALGRYWRHRGTVRDSAAPGCVEKLDGEFLRWLLWESRSPAQRAGYAAIAGAWPEKLVRLRSRRQVRAFLRTICGAEGPAGEKGGGSHADHCPDGKHRPGGGPAL